MTESSASKGINVVKNKCIIFIIALLLILAGCSSTQELLNSSNYTERFSSFYMSDDGSKLIIFTDDYHYIFKTPKNFIEVLGSSYAKELIIGFDVFWVKEDNSIYGRVKFKLKRDWENKRAVMNEANADGFLWSAPNWFSQSMYLAGVRYQSKGDKPQEPPQALSKRYRVLIKSLNKDKKTKHSLAGKIQDTPITIAKDVVNIGGAALVMPVFIGCAIAGCE